MPAGALTSKLSDHTKVLQKLVTADHSSAVDAGWVDARNFRKFAVSTTATVLTGVGLTAFVLEANSASDGTGTNVVLATHAVGTAPDAAGDSLWLEADLDDAAVASAGARYVNAKITAANALDDTNCTYILSGIKHAAAGQSADVIA